MDIEVTTVTGRAELRRFVFLPEKLNRDHPNWLPPIYSDDLAYFDPAKNRAFGYCDTLTLLAWRGSEPVGRVLGIVNRRCNEFRKERVARFSHLECPDDSAVFGALMERVEGWARGLGMQKLVGPFGFTDQDPEGFLVEGFDEVPTLACNANLPYVNRLLEGRGYGKDVDYVVYILPVPEAVPPAYERIIARLTGRGGLRALEFTRRRELGPWVRPVLGLMNETYVSLYGYAPLDETEMDDLARRYVPLLDPRLVKVVLKDDAVVGFVIGMANFTDGLRRARGRLFPFGILHILADMKRSKQLDLMLGGIRADCRGRGIDALLAMTMLRSAYSAGFRVIDTHSELETNTAVRAEMERFGGKVRKRFRVYQRPL
jgi:predicted GNAT family acetyltransferase